MIKRDAYRRATEHRPDKAAPILPPLTSRCCKCGDPIPPGTNVWFVQGEGLQCRNCQEE